MEASESMTAGAHRVYKRAFRVRSYECDSFGHVNNAVYQNYLEQTAIEASADAGYPMEWYEQRGTAWVLRQISIEYLRPSQAGDLLQTTTWVSSWRRVRAQREYRIERLPQSEVIVRASADWVYVDRTTFQPRRIPQQAIADFSPTGPSELDPYPLPAEGLDSARYRWQHRVKRYELDSMQHVNNAVYLNWVEEAKFRAAESVGWPVERMIAENFVTFQIRHDTEYFLPARNGDEIDVISRLYALRRVRGTWLHEIYRAGTGELLARNYSTGAFLDRQGRPARAPQAMLDAILQGVTDPASQDGAGWEEKPTHAAHPGH